MSLCNNCKVEKDASEFYPSYKSQCKQCLKAKAALKRGEKLQYLRDWKLKNPTAFKDWYANNREARADYWQRWYDANKEHRAESYAEWAKANKATINALIAKRTAAKRNATPKWADPKAIKSFYELAARLTAETGVRHEVDHIYPLQGVDVCGLHCEANLQVLTKVENIRKSNRMPEVAHEPKRYEDVRAGDGPRCARVR